MARRVPFFGASVVVFGILVPASTAAEPIIVESGYIQMGNGLNLHIFTTGPHLVGEYETGVSETTPILFGRPGDTVNLSSQDATHLSNFSVDAPPGPSNAFGSVDFTFTAGDAVVPSIASPGSTTTVSAPFTFTGVVFGYASLADAMGGGTPTARWELAGSGRAEALFHMRTTPTGIPLPNEPYAAYGFVYYFEAAEPVPEPGTWLLLGSGLAGLRAWRRRR